MAKIDTVGELGRAEMLSQISALDGTAAWRPLGVIVLTAVSPLAADRL
jgi:hypothetical protein